VRVLQIGSGVAGGLGHPLRVEDVVLLQAVRQVGVLDRGQRDLGGRMLLGGVQEAFEGDGAAVTSLDRGAAGPQHHAEADVLRLHIVRQVSGHPGDGEDQLKVVCLPGVGDVDDAFGTQLVHPEADRGHICGVVAVAPGRVADDRRSVEAVHEDHQGPAVLDGDAAGLQIIGDLAEHLVVGGLPRHVLVGEQHIHPLVGAVEPGQRDLDQALPRGPGLRIARLQLHDPLAGAFGERLVLIEMGVGAPVERFGAGQIEGVQIEHLVGDLLDQHAELASPVTDVVLGEHSVSLGAQHPVETVADDGRPQVTDVHLLGHVR